MTLPTKKQIRAKPKEKYCMPDNVNTQEEYNQYLSDIGAITWEFVEWAEKSTGEAFIKGIDIFNRDYEAIGIIGHGEIIEIREIEVLK